VTPMSGLASIAFAASMSSSVSFGGRPPSGLRAEQQQDLLGCARGSSCARILPARQTCEKPAAPARSSCRGLRSDCETRCPSTAGSRRSRSTASSTAPGGRAFGSRSPWPPPFAPIDSDTGNLFTLQNEITSRIAVALNIELTSREAARPTEHPDALDYILRGRAAYWKPNSLAKWEETVSLFERALTLDPQSVEAQSWLATSLAIRVASGSTYSATLETQRAEELVGKALAASPRNWVAHYAKATLRLVQHRCEEAIPEYEIVLALNPYWMNTLVFLGSCKLLTGSIEEVIPLCEQAIRLSPRDPFIWIPFILIGQVHLLQSRTDEAIAWFERARSVLPRNPELHALLSSAYALKGETERAAAELEEAQREGYYSNIAHLKVRQDFGVPKVRALFETTYFAGLRKAGMPEE
jgi:adenylate cyclase